MKTKKFKCPYCGTEYEMDWIHSGQTISLFGRNVKCANCGKAFIAGQVAPSHSMNDYGGQKGDSTKDQETPVKIDEEILKMMAIIKLLGKALIPKTLKMRVIAGAFLLLIVAPWSYGFISAFLDSGNMPLISVIITTQSMNPITRHGYMFYLKTFTDFRQRLNEINRIGNSF